MKTRTRYSRISANNASVLLLGVPTPGATVVTIKKSHRAQQVQETVQPIHYIADRAFRVEFGTNVVKTWHSEWPLSATGRNLYEAEQKILAQARDLAASTRRRPIEALDEHERELRDFLFDVL